MGTYRKINCKFSFQRENHRYLQMGSFQAMFEVTVGYGMDAPDAPERLCNETRFQKVVFVKWMCRVWHVSLAGKSPFSSMIFPF